MAAAAESLSTTRPRLRSFVYVAPVDDGAVFRTWAGAFVMHGRGLYALVERLVPALDGSRTVAELCAGLPDAAAQKVAAVLAKLIERGVLVDEAARTSAPVSDSELELYSSSLAYLDLHLGDPGPPFVRFRASRVVLIGDGLPLRAAARALFAMGLRVLTVAASVDARALAPVAADFDLHHTKDSLAMLVQRPLDDILSDLPSYDFVAHAGVGDNSLLYTQLERDCRRAGLPLLQAAVVSGWGVVGPVTGRGAPACWQCVSDRLTPHVGTPGPTTGLLIGNALAYDVFRSLSGSRRDSGERTLLTVDPDTLETERRPLVPWGECKHTTPPSSTPGTVDAEWRDSDAGRDVAGRISALQPLLDPVTGLVKVGCPDDWDQVPLSLAEASVIRRGIVPSRRIGWGDTPAEAQYDALCQCLEDVGASQLDPAATTVQAAASGHSYAECAGLALLRALGMARCEPEMSADDRTVDAWGDVRVRHLLRMLRLRYGREVRIGVARLGCLNAARVTISLDRTSCAGAVGRNAGEALHHALRAAVVDCQLGRVTPGRQPCSPAAAGRPTCNLDPARDLAPTLGWAEWLTAATCVLESRGDVLKFEPWLAADSPAPVGLLIGRVTVYPRARGDA